MYKTLRRLGVGFVAALALVAMLAGLALAHERRDVAGKYTFVVGWADEPSYAGQLNGVSLNVTNTQTKAPVESLEKTVKVEIIQGAQKRELPLRAVFRQPGVYAADVVPTKEGDYRFRFFGTIEGTQIDETFDSADGKFDGVKSSQAILFPVDATTAAQLAPASAAGAAQPSAAGAAASAATGNSTAASLAVVALVVGVLALLVGIVALVRGRSAAAASRGERAVTSQG